MIREIGGSFAEVGGEFLGYFKDLANLKPDESVLEVGCGVGRVALPLTSYLSDNGNYKGFDIVPEWITWCSRNISLRYPNFEFTCADVFNGTYNPGGKLTPSEFDFPYQAGSFDFLIATSVFTHLVPKDVEHYLVEIKRVLQPAGRCLLTFFLLNSESIPLVESKRSFPAFPNQYGLYRTVNKDTPEIGVAYEESFVRQSLGSAGLTLIEPIHYGSWSGRKGYLSFQDILLVTR
jgi:SAM-dependent methyltransferase